MSWRVYAFSFMPLAFMFVPVLFYFGFYELVAPCCYGLYETLNSPMDEVGRWFLAVYLALYFGLFLLIAFLTFRLSTLFAEGSTRTLIQATFLVALFSCSFLTVITEAGGMVEAYQTGTYNFWKACARFPHSSHH